MADPRLRFKPVTKATRADFVEVFKGKGGPSYCWCMVFRATTEELKDTSRPAREKQMLDRVDGRVPVGLVGYLDGDPVAWVSIAPKDTCLRLGGPPPRDGENIWSLVCMYMRRGLRHQGYAGAVIDAAIEHASKKGATAVEAYPVTPDSPSYRFGGFVQTFAARGFTELEMAGTRRHVMRLTLAAGSGAKG